MTLPYVAGSNPVDHPNFKRTNNDQTSAGYLSGPFVYETV